MFLTFNKKSSKPVLNSRLPEESKIAIYGYCEERFIRKHQLLFIMCQRFSTNQ